MRGATSVLSGPKGDTTRPSLRGGIGPTAACDRQIAAIRPSPPVMRRRMTPKYRRRVAVLTTLPQDRRHASRPEARVRDGCAPHLSFEDRQDPPGHRSRRITLLWTSGRTCEPQRRPRRCCGDSRPTKSHAGLAKAAGGVGRPPSLMDFIEEFGAPGEIRTPDHLVRSQVLYPTELRARFGTTDSSNGLLRLLLPFPALGARIGAFLKARRRRSTAPAAPTSSAISLRLHGGRRRIIKRPETSRHP